MIIQHDFSSPGFYWIQGWAATTSPTATTVCPPTVLMHKIRRFNLSRKLLDQSAITPPSVYHLSKQDELSAFYASESKWVQPLDNMCACYNYESHLTTIKSRFQALTSSTLSTWIGFICLVCFRTTTYALHCLLCSKFRPSVDIFVSGGGMRRYVEFRMSCEGPA